MNPNHTIDRKRYITFPAKRRRPHVMGRILRRLWSLCVIPYVLAAARLRGTPGLAPRIQCIRLGLSALVAGDLRRSFMLIANPMDSFRYFELDFALHVVRQSAVRRYLDVSSPRLLPLMTLKAYPSLVAELLNPVAEDLEETATTAASLGLGERCLTRSALLEDADYPEGVFDLITSISVVEHIPDDSGAIAKMWGLLRPGGKLVITVPCAREACEEYANLDEYGLLTRDKDGFVYWQRYYDETALARRIWAVTGRPTSMRIFGERRPGSYDDNVRQKRTDPAYPYWNEPLMMGRDYTYYDRLGQLPGMGVIAMEFTKPPVAQQG